MSHYVNVAIPPLSALLSYKLPEGLNPDLTIGCRVSVPLGNRSASGFIVSKTIDLPQLEKKKKSAQEDLWEKEPDRKIKSINLESELVQCFQSSQLEFFEKVASYYGDSLANILDVAVPPYVPKKVNKLVHFVSEPTSQSRSQKRPLIITELKAKGALEHTYLLKKYKNCAPILKKLAEENCIRIEEEEIFDTHLDSTAVPEWTKQQVDLTQDQLHAVAKIVSDMNSSEFRTHLLHGVTGSGKTEVYIEAAQDALRAGKSVMIIVPEIALTPQLLDRFRARLGQNISILHSGLQKRERWDSWRALVEKRSFVAIGARSAIFAPLENVGLIVVDEEHDGSYKQSEGLRYNARDVAILRGKFHNCPVVLGSATPSIETYYRARTGAYSLLNLPTRYSSSDSLKISIVDLNQLRPWEMKTRNISPELYTALEKVIENGDQAFLLYNRRGFASYLQCDKCGSAMECPNCSVTLTFHQKKNMLVCHYCNIHKIPPSLCPVCPEGDSQNPGKLQERGSGTEKVYDEVCSLFPDTKIDRLDRDTVSNFDSYKRILDDVRQKRTQILVGTQMIAKGHDLPDVTLVGIVDCDVGLHMPDFRASERVFQLLTQASGRAGRGDKAGRVILQTRVPKHPCLVKTVDKDYEGFAKIELAQRQNLQYPPFSRLLRIIVSSEQEELPLPILERYRDLAQKFIDQKQLDATMLGPAPAPLQRIKNRWRWHLLCKSSSAKILNQIMKGLQRSTKVPKNLRVTFDMDPLEML